MSIANIIIQRPAGFLLTDMGHFNLDATVHRIEAKILHLGSFGMAVSCRGGGGYLLQAILGEIGAACDRSGSRKAGDVMKAFPEIFHTAFMVESSRFSGPLNGEAQILYWSPERGRTVGYVIASSPDEIGGSAAWTMHSVLSSLTNDFSPDAPLGRECDIGDPAQFDIERDGLALMEAQRRKPWKPRGAALGHYAAGGVMLTTVDATGVRTKRLATWPDRVGERVAG